MSEPQRYYLLLVVENRAPWRRSAWDGPKRCRSFRYGLNTKTSYELQNTAGEVAGLPHATQKFLGRNVGYDEKIPRCQPPSPVVGPGLSRACLISAGPIAPTPFVPHALDDPHPAEVTVLDGSSGPGPEGHFGVRWTSPPISPARSRRRTGKLGIQQQYDRGITCGGGIPGATARTLVYSILSPLSSHSPPTR